MHIGLRYVVMSLQCKIIGCDCETVACMHTSNNGWGLPWKRDTVALLKCVGHPQGYGIPARPPPKNRVEQGKKDNQEGCTGSLGQEHEVEDDGQSSIMYRTTGRVLRCTGQPMDNKVVQGNKERTRI